MRTLPYITHDEWVANTFKPQQWKIYQFEETTKLKGLKFALKKIKNVSINNSD